MLFSNHPEKVISEVARVLKSGGKAFIIDFDADGNRVSATLIKCFLRIFRGKYIAQNFFKSFSGGLRGEVVKKMMVDYGIESVKYRKSGPNYFLIGTKPKKNDN